jgi:delta 1-pyrroline-5-carboxylate dehydrogenase
LFYRCENARAVGAIVTDVAEEEAADAVETSVILALQAWKNTHRKKRALLLITLAVTAAGETDAALAVVHMEEVVADSLGH